MKLIPKKIADASLRTRTTTRRAVIALQVQKSNHVRNATTTTVGAEVFGEGSQIFTENGGQLFG